MKKQLTLFFAITITSVAVLIAVASGLERGSTLFDQVIFVTLAVSVTLLAHLLPALIQGRLALVVWAFCLVVSFYGYMVFFTGSQSRTGEAQAEHVLASDSSLDRLADLKLSRDAIQSRSISLIANDLSVTKESHKRSALLLELQEAKRKITLQKQIDAMRDSIGKERDSVSHSDVVTKSLGVTGGTVSFVVAFLMSLLVEISGAILWFNLLHAKPSEPEQAKSENVHKAVNQDLVQVMQAISSGKCQKSQRAIRQYLGCSQSKATELNRLVKTSLH
jgi:hypothetical protein